MSIERITIDFEKTIKDIDLSDMKVNVEVNKKKTIFYMEKRPLEIERSKILFVPKK